MEDQKEGFANLLYKKFGDSIPLVKEPGGNLLSLFNDGDRDAFTTIYNKLYPSIYYFACRFVNAEEAEDLTAEAFCKVWKMQKNFERLQGIKVFLQVTVRNACINYLEHEKVIAKQQKEWVHLSGGASDELFYQEEIREEFIQLVYTEIEKLPVQCKKIFKLSYLEGIKNKAIASKLGISEKTVRNQKTKALKFLRMAVYPLNCIITLFLIQKFLQTIPFFHPFFPDFI